MGQIFKCTKKELLNRDIKCLILPGGPNIMDYCTFIWHFDDIFQRYRSARNQCRPNYQPSRPFSRRKSPKQRIAPKNDICATSPTVGRARTKTGLSIPAPAEIGNITTVTCQTVYKVSRNHCTVELPYITNFKKPSKKVRYRGSPLSVIKEVLCLEIEFQIKIYRRSKNENFE